MARRWTQTEDTTVRLATALDYEDGGQRLRELAARLGRTEAAVRWRAWRLRSGPARGRNRVTGGPSGHRPVEGRLEHEAMTGGTLTRAALVERVVDVADLTKKRAEVIVETVFGSIAESLRRGEKVELRGFGSFASGREPHRGRNPRTGDRVDVAGSMGSLVPRRFRGPDEPVLDG